MSMFKHATRTPANPSRRATKRVPDPQPVPTECPHCQSSVELVNNSVLYGKEYGAWPWAYRCTSAECDSHVGLHPYTAIPLGTLANKPIREARARAKKDFIKLWDVKGAPMTREEAYSWLAQRMGLTRATCHFGLFDVEQCNRAQNIIHGTAKR